MQVAAFQSVEEAVADTEGGAEEGAVETFGKGEKTGIAPEVVTELMEGEEALLCLLKEGGVGLYVGEHDGVVDMDDGVTMLAQLLAKEDVLETVGADALVEGDKEHDVTTDHEIGGAEGTVGVTGTLGGTVARLLAELVAVAEVGALEVGIGGDGDTTVDDGWGLGITGRGLLGVEIALEETGGGNGDVGIEEEEPGVAGLAGKDIADGSTADIDAALQIAAAGMGGDLSAEGCEGAVGGAVVGNDDLVAEGGGQRLRLSAELGNKGAAVDIIDGQEDGQLIGHTGDKGTKKI